ncbi:MAG: aromatic acid decarboxylase [Candidatus Altiarchaeales archaeon HGW-Altiarchaeales-1]|nr:MAG: aromatic acid decarboxylase [Candidatus Altiarchaeales archaeon HGW-Altiarchaeales-1]
MRIIVGITGASGAILAKRFLEILKNLKIETDLIITDEGRAVIKDEINNETGNEIRNETTSNEALKEIENLAAKIFNINDFSADIASGSNCYGKNKRDALVIIPCSMNTVAKLAGGISDNLILRTCDVMLKENKKVIVVPRECPLNYNHLENLLKLKGLNIVIIPPVLTFYHEPKTIEDMINFTIGKILDNLDIEHNIVKRWKN